MDQCHRQKQINNAMSLHLRTVQRTPSKQYCTFYVKHSKLSLRLNSTSSVFLFTLRPSIPCAIAVQPGSTE